MTIKVLLSLPTCFSDLLASSFRLISNITFSLSFCSSSSLRLSSSFSIYHNKVLRLKVVITMVKRVRHLTRGFHRQWKSLRSLVPANYQPTKPSSRQSYLQGSQKNIMRQCLWLSPEIINLVVDHAKKKHEASASVRLKPLIFVDWRHRVSKANVTAQILFFFNEEPTISHLDPTFSLLRLIPKSTQTNEKNVVLKYARI